MPTSFVQSGVVLAVIASSFSGVSLKTIAPESGDRRRTSSVSMDSLAPPAQPRHLILDAASADLERD